MKIFIFVTQYIPAPSILLLDSIKKITVLKQILNGQDNYYYKSIITNVIIENNEFVYEKYFDLTKEHIKLYKLK